MEKLFQTSGRNGQTGADYCYSLCVTDYGIP